MQKVLVIDDDHDICFLLNKYLTKQGFKVFEALTARKALEILDNNEVDAVLCDFRLEGTDGITMIGKIKEKQNVPVIMITAHNDLKIAVTAMKMGAYDFVLKPLFPEEILNTLKSAMGNSMTEHAGMETKEGPPKPGTSTSKNKPAVNNEIIYGNSAAFQQILHQVTMVATTDYSVIIYGESGSGKEAIAQLIHHKSERAKFPFIAIDCGALSKELAGSELFGHEKGSFTGAVNQKIGSFEMANGGTIFLDEITNLSYEIQISLLRVVQERKMRRIGGNKDISLNVRIIIASNEKLSDAVQQGKFREDLFHRFNEFTINIPPLRERKDDIKMFASHFLEQANKLLNKNIKGFSQAVDIIFRNYGWPGNLRELKNVVKRAALLSDGDIIQESHLPFEISNFTKLQFDQLDEKENQHELIPIHEPVKHTHELKGAEHSLKVASIDHEYEVIVKTLKENNFNKSKAAKSLNIDRKTLYNKIALYQELVQKKSHSDE